MIKFKHKETGKIAERVTQPLGYCLKSESLFFPCWLIENSNDWEEVKENGYEILEFSCDIVSVDLKRNENSGFGQYQVDENTLLNSSLHKIYSVKRLSDGEIFTIGDLVSREDGLFKGVLNSINEKFEASTSSEDLIGMGWLKKVKQPLFTTEDGKDIYVGDKFWVVDKKYGSYKTHETAGGHFTKFHEDRLRFSTRELAEEYVLMYKPCLSAIDVINYSAFTSLMRKEVIELAKSKINQSDK